MDSTKLQPLFSVVIPTFERNDLLANCLQCLAPGNQKEMKIIMEGLKVEGVNSESQTGRTRVDWESEMQNQTLGATYEVIVSDDGRKTTAETMIREQFPWARWVAGPGAGPAANRNCGVTLARGSWIAFTDDDCLPQSLWLHSLLSVIRDDPLVDVVEGRTIPDRPRRRLAEHAPTNENGGLMWSCNIAIRAETFLMLRGFDERFKHCMEDNDLSFRVRASKARDKFSPDALVIHPWRMRGSGRDGWKKTGDYLNDLMLYLAKHPSERKKLNGLRFLRIAIRRGLQDLGWIIKNRVPGDLRYWFHLETARLQTALVVGWTHGLFGKDASGSEPNN
jgi:GT2 family glycosyltransferase